MVEGVGSEEESCEFLEIPKEGLLLSRCRISLEPGSVSGFCAHCEVPRIRKGPHCRHLGFHTRTRVNWLGTLRVQALLSCRLHGDTDISLADCVRCPDYEANGG